MEPEQFEDCQKIVRWCADTAPQMQAEGSTPEEIILACFNGIDPHEETCIHPDVVVRTVQAFLS